MNLSALKSFAPAMRRQLIEAVGRKLDVVLTGDTADLRAARVQVEKLRQQAKADRQGLVERVAYTWFNRLSALRLLDARGWHPFRARVLTPATAEETQSEVLKLVRAGALPAELASLTDPARLNQLLDVHLPSSDPQGEVYRHLVLATCRFYHRLMPFLFEALDDETELLLPDDLLTAHSVVHGFRTAISDEDCAEVEVLGWLYQFYIAERKDQVMARKSAVPSEDIPAVTQLFTPHWIVRYLVENSLGRLWLLNRPGSRIREHMPYYVEDSEEVASDRWLVTSKERENNVCEQLQGSGGLAESDRTGRGHLSDKSELSQMGALWSDQSASESSRVSTIKHSRRSGKEINSRVQELPLDSPGIIGRSGNATDHCPATELSPTARNGSSSLSTYGGGQDAQFSNQQTGVVASDQWLVTREKTSDQPLATSHLRVERPEDIRLLDPACGSGHMLTYAFDLLVKIYEEEGHAPSEIPGLILRHNLYGLEICPRAAQLAQFALVCKAREHARAAFRNPVQPQVMCLQDVVFDDDELQNFSSAVHCPLSTVHLKQLHQFRENTSTFGSLIQPVLTADEIASLKAKIGDTAPPGDLIIQDTHRKICCALDQAEMLSQRYHVIVANPPYMRIGSMNKELRVFSQDNYCDSKPDLYAMFIKRNIDLAMKKGYVAMITMQSWMFLTSFERLRKYVLENYFIYTMAHLGPRAFDTIGGEVVSTTAFVIKCLNQTKYKGKFFRLVDGDSEAEKELLLRKTISMPLLSSDDDFKKIPSRLISYWLSDDVRSAFIGKKLSECLLSEGAVKTGNNSIFLRYLWEVSSKDISKDGKWRKHPKGGEYRKWYGNLEWCVDWSEKARKHYKDDFIARIPTEEIWDLSGITWTSVASEKPSFRILLEDEIANNSALFVYPKISSELKGCLCYLNSKLARLFLNVLNPTIQYLVGDILNTPKPNCPLDNESIYLIASQMLSKAQSDWDNFETSWDFRDLPLLRPGLKGATLEESWNNWASYCRANIARMQELETENNRIWIDAYGLQDELTPEVPENEITLARPDQRKDIAAFLSYAVGCMMGRYRLDRLGLIYAHSGNVDFEKIYFSEQEIVTSDQWLVAREKTSHQPPATSPDGIIPILDGDWFEDDIVARTRQFLRITFGDATLEANLRFLETSLGKDLRKYFLIDFYKDHLQTYKKRPIYWLFQSPKKGFSALIYLHRYTRDTANRVLNRYLREYLHKLQARLDQLDHIQGSAGASARDKTQARKESDQIRKIRRDCEDYERDILLPLAQQRLELDLDDGVKVNYLKLGEALAPIPGLAASSE